MVLFNKKHKMEFICVYLFANIPSKTRAINWAVIEQHTNVSEIIHLGSFGFKNPFVKSTRS
jgi:hypothetical protein